MRLPTQILHFMVFQIYIKGGQMLQLPRARLEDAGQYVCTATNSAGQDQKSILLSVYGEQTHGVHVRHLTSDKNNSIIRSTTKSRKTVCLKPAVTVQKILSIANQAKIVPFPHVQTISPSQPEAPSRPCIRPGHATSWLLRHPVM